MEGKGYRLVAGRPAPLKDESFDALGERHQAQAQRRGAGMHGRGLRPEKHEKRVALLCDKMQAVHTVRMRSVGPAKQGGAGIVFQDLLGGPQGVALCFRIDP